MLNRREGYKTGGCWDSELRRLKGGGYMVVNSLGLGVRVFFPLIIKI